MKRLALPRYERWQRLGVWCARPGMRHGLWAALACGWLTLCAAAACGQPPAGSLALGGQTTWEYRPYQIAVWLALDRTSPHADAIVEELADWLPRRSQAVVGAAWQLEIQEAPVTVGELLELAELPSLTWEKLFPAAPQDAGAVLLGDLEAKDKIVLVRLTNPAGATQVSVRQIDVRTRQVGPLVTRTSASRLLVPLAVWDALVASFAPLARIERVEGQEVTARLRAGGLQVSPLATRWVPEIEGASETQTEQELTDSWLDGTVAFQPILRRTIREGRPGADGIQPLPWTLLEVQRRDGPLLVCRLHSAFRSLLPPRGSPRLERLALAVKPVASSTTLILRAPSDEKPLVGYELYLARETETRETEGGPDAANADASSASGQQRLLEKVGVTDLRGQVTIDRRSDKVVVLLVRHGRQLLARLPLVPGQTGPLTVALPDDDPRLTAEALSQALAVRSLDLVALREVMAARFRAQVRAGKSEEARELLDAVRRWPSRANLTRELENFRQQVSSPDRLTQARIDRLFAETQKLLLERPLSDEWVVELGKELASAGR